MSEFCHKQFTRFVTMTIKFVYILNPSQPQLVLKLFLLFADFQPQCSYKIVIIKKKEEYICVPYIYIYPYSLFENSRGRFSNLFYFTFLIILIIIFI